MLLAKVIYDRWFMFPKFSITTNFLCPSKQQPFKVSYSFQSSIFHMQSYSIPIVFLFPYFSNYAFQRSPTLINFHELREIVMTGGLYTWSNNQENPILEKLDRILASKEWEDIFPNTMWENSQEKSLIITLWYSPLVLVELWNTSNSDLKIVGSPIQTFCLLLERYMGETM